MESKTVTVTYYAEHTDDPKTWASPRPSFDVEKFQRELTRRGGSIGSVPRFRLRWAGDCDEYILEEFDTLEGYIYIENGVEKFVSAKDTEFELPDGAIWTPKYESHQIYIPRWAIEEYREPFYEKFWIIQEVEQTGYQSGRVDLLSRYRYPSEIDLKFIETYVYKRENLSADEVRNGIARKATIEANREKAKRAEFVHSIEEDFDKAMKDGLPNASKFGFDPKLTVNISQHSKNLIKEHDKTI